MCPNCGSCFSKKSNLYNHLHRGKGCPKRNEKDSSGGSGVETPSKQEEKREKATKRGKIRYAIVKQEEYYESDEELSDLIIDDRNETTIPDTAERVTETEDDEIEDEEVEEHVEESYVEVHQPQRQDRLEFLRANRDLLQPRRWESSDSKSTPSPPPSRPTGSAPLNNLHQANFCKFLRSKTWPLYLKVLTSQS